MLSRREFVAHSTPANAPGNQKTIQQPVGKGKLRGKRKSNAKSFDAPYKKMTPILSNDDDDVIMDQDDDEYQKQDDGSETVKDPIIHCIYCQDIGSFMWICTNESCRIPVCVSKAKGDHGCVDASPDDLTEEVRVTEGTFRCPQCYRAEKKPIPYGIRGYAVRQEFIHRNYFPLLAVFLSWSGFGREFAADVVKRTLEEHFHLDHTRLRTVSRKLRGGNNRPNAVRPHFDWLARLNYQGNLLVFIDTHSDTATGNLVVSGNATNSNSVPTHELLQNYLGDNLKFATQAMREINKAGSVGPCIRGIVVCACGSTGRVPESVNSLKRLVELDIFDFVLTFAGVSTIDTLVVPALNRFIENVFVYNMKFWSALEQSFGEDRHALNSSPIMLSFAETKIGTENERQRVFDTRVLAYSNFKDGRPWGLDIYRCSCGAPAYNMIFHPDGKQLHGKHWIQTKMKYECLQCHTVRRHISCPDWIHRANNENFGRVSYRWPLSLSQRQDIGITH